jgi:hypothetical protein
MTTLNVLINARKVLVEVTPAAERALAARNKPLYVELELYFSCLVKKFVHFRDDSRDKPTVAVANNLLLYFRPVTSTACTFEVAEQLGRQPEMDVDCEALHHVAPKRVFIDYVAGKWRGSYEFL